MKTVRYPIRFVTHSRRVQQIAASEGWYSGARYTNIRDVKTFPRLGFLDIDWKNYDFKWHLQVAEKTRPLFTVARDIVSIKDLDIILEEAEYLSNYSCHVILVPKDRKLKRHINRLIPDKFLLGYSVSSSYGGTAIEPKYFDRPTHLLGGRPDIQRKLANEMWVISLDCNRFTIDAAYGDFFDGETFRPHPIGGYDTCLRHSIVNINRLWDAYSNTFSCRKIDSWIGTHHGT